MIDLIIDFCLWIIAAVFIFWAIVAIIYFIAILLELALVIVELITTIFEPIIDKLNINKPH